MVASNIVEALREKLLSGILTEGHFKAKVQPIYSVPFWIMTYITQKQWYKCISLGQVYPTTCALASDVLCCVVIMIFKEHFTDMD